MGIESNRRWGVCSLNEFRKACVSVHLLRFLPNSISSLLQFLGLKSRQCLLHKVALESNVTFLTEYESFLEWNSDKEIAEAAEHLYTHIDNLELYVGLQAEEAKKPVDGAGLCPGMFECPSLFT